MSNINIYLIEDDPNSIKSFTVAISKLEWLKSLLRIDDSLLHKLDSCEITHEDLMINLNDNIPVELVCNKILFDEDFRGNRNNILSIVDEFDLNHQYFHLNNHDAYINASSIFDDLKIINSCHTDIHILMLDLETYRIKEEEIYDLRCETLHELPQFYLNGERTSRFLASLDLVIQFNQIGLEHGFIIPSTLHTQSLNFSELSPDLRTKIRNLLRIETPYWLEGRSSVESQNQYYKIFEVFCETAKALYSSPVKILRNKSRLNEEKKRWFSDKNELTIHHNYLKTSVYDKAPKTIQHWLNIRPNFYNNFLHEGFKDIGLDGDLRPPSLYSLVLLAAAKKKALALSVLDTTQFPGAIPNYKNRHKIKTEACDFATLLYNFFSDFLLDKEGEIRQVNVLHSYEGNFLLLQSAQCVQDLFDRVVEHLHNLDNDQNLSIGHNGSKYLALCIYHGKWGLTGRQENKREAQGLFDISFTEKEVRFSWKIQTS
jgi:hypothetical protein